MIIGAPTTLNASAISSALLTSNAEPSLTLFRNTTIGGRMLGDITGDGNISSTDALQYSKWANGSLTDTNYLSWINNTMNPYILANRVTYANYINFGTPILFSTLQNEFGGSNPISLSEYYVGAGIVRSTYPDGFPINSGIPSSGAITMSSFYNGQGVFVFTYTITSNFGNFNLNNVMLANGWNGINPVLVNVTINSGVTVVSYGYNGTSDGTGGTPAFYVGTLPARSTVTITNNGIIAGCGGFGAQYGPSPSGDAGHGTPAFVTEFAGTTNLINNYRIIGGGGGGGGGSTGPAFTGAATPGNNDSFGGGNGGNGGAAMVVKNGYLVITNNAVIGGGAGGGNGGNGIAWSDCGVPNALTPYYLSEGGGGGGGGRGGSPLAPAYGGAPGAPFYCSGYPRDRNAASGQAGITDVTLPSPTESELAYGGLGGRLLFAGVYFTAGQGGFGGNSYGGNGVSGQDGFESPYVMRAFVAGRNTHVPGQGGETCIIGAGGSRAYTVVGTVYGDY